MSAHTGGSEQGQSLCDLLWHELARLRPDISRSESDNWCSLFHPPRGRIAFIKHRKEFLRVYFLSRPDLSLGLVPPALRLFNRTATESAWAKRFPLSFQISEPEHARLAARFLSDYSYPLAARHSSSAPLAEHDTSDGEYATDLASAIAQAVQNGDFSPATLEDARQRTLRAVVLRRGQPEFRSSLISAYGARCAITDCDAVAALEAAHIIAYCGPRSNDVCNGLLLRADIHTLFDLDLIGVHPDALVVAVAPALFGTCFARLAGHPIAVPKRESCKPDREALASRWAKFARQKSDPA